MNASPATRGLVTAAAAVLGAKLGEKQVYKAGLKPLSPALEKNMTKLTDDAHESFAKSLRATQSEDNAEMLYKSSPGDSGARSRLHDAVHAEISAWNAYAANREHLVIAVNTAQRQGFEVEKYHDQAAELLSMEEPIFNKVSNAEARLRGE